MGKATSNAFATPWEPPIGKIANSKFLTPFWQIWYFSERHSQAPTPTKKSHSLPFPMPQLVGRALLVSVLMVCRVSCLWWWLACLSLGVCGVVMLACGVCVLRLSYALMVSYPNTIDKTYSNPHINSLSYPFHSRSLGRVTRSEWVRDSALLH